MLQTTEKNKLYQLLEDFYNAIGIRIAIFDSGFNKITEYPQNAPPLCALIRNSKEGLMACQKCDEMAFKHVKETQTTYSYICHAGLTEIVTPLTSNGMIVGYAIFAHLLPKENYENNVNEICRRCAVYCDDKEKLLSAISKHKIYPEKKISASVRLLEAINSYLQLSAVINWTNEDIVYNLNQFIENNISSDLSCDVLCSHFYISRTKLHQLATQHFGMSIGKYILFKKIEIAKKLLKDKSLSIAQVGQKVGVNDYNYFCKLFKKTTNVTPGQYRISTLS